MRTTLVIDDDVLRAVKKIATLEKRSVGKVISSLTRKALSPSEASFRKRNEVPLIKPLRRANRVTSELVHRLREELP